MKAHTKHHMNGLDENLNQVNIQRGQRDIILLQISTFQGMVGHVSSSFWCLDH